MRVHNIKELFAKTVLSLHRAWVLARSSLGCMSPGFRTHTCSPWQSCEEFECSVPGIKTTFKMSQAGQGGFCPRHPSPPAPAHTEGPLHADALQAITEVTSELQHSLVQLESLQKLTELQRDLVGIESLVAPGRVSGFI